MKIRSSYVSNSSSSSFVIFGQEISNPTKYIEQGEKVLVYVPKAGTSGEAEDWVMYIDLECWKYLSKTSWFNEVKRYSKFFIVDSMAKEVDDEYEKISVIEDIKQKQIFGFRRDYSSPNNLEQLQKFIDDYERIYK